MRRAILVALVAALPVCADQVAIMDEPCRVFFSPRGQTTDAIVTMIHNAKSSLRVQSYSFTSRPIAEALIAAHRRGVDVQVVADKVATGKSGVAAKLRSAGIPVFIDRAHAIQHNKVLIADGAVVELGSFNYSNAAEYSNAENAMICQSTSLADLYTANWDLHRNHSEVLP